MALLLLLAFWWANPPEDPSPDEGPERSTREWLAQVSMDAARIADTLKGRDQEPWFKGHDVAHRILTIRIQLAAIQNYSRDVQQQLDGDFPDEDRARKLIEKYDREVRHHGEIVTAFQKLFQTEGRIVTQAFSRVAGANTHLGNLLDIGVRCPREQGSMREITRQYEQGRRYWLSQVNEVLLGRKPDGTMQQLGLKNVKSAGDAAVPLLQLLQPARIEAQQLGNHMAGIEHRLEWLGQILPLIPKTDPIHSEPRGRLDTWQSRWKPVRETARGLQVKALDRSREHLVAVRSSREKMSALLKELSGVFIPLARRYDLALPKKTRDG